MITKTRSVLIVGITALAAMVPGLLVHAQQTPPVVIQVPGNLKAGTPFSAQLKNGLATPITFCTDFGRAIQTESGPHAAPNPFEIQKWNGKRWDTQLIGTDVGSGNTAVSIDAHKSSEFSLEIPASGRYRLRLTYQEGESDTKCPLPPEHTTTIRSKPFSVQKSVQK